MLSKDKTWEVVSQELGADSYEIVAAQNEAPPRRQLEVLASDLNCKFSSEFLAHASGEYGGLYVAAKEDIWPRSKAFSVGPFWSFLYGVYTLNETPEIPDFMNIRKTCEEFQTTNNTKLVPFLKVISDADCYCFDDSGAIHQWNHELGESEILNISFFELLRRELHELNDRKRKMQTNAV